MNPKVKALWIDALRSGEYVQGKNYLQLDGEYCCLGVLCEIAVKAGVISKDIRQSGSIAYDGKTTTLPEGVVQWSGVQDEWGDFTNGDGFRDSLVMLNDSGEYDFRDIANVIEKHF
jgi:hypothetical protein